MGRESFGLIAVLFLAVALTGTSADGDGCGATYANSTTGTILSQDPGAGKNCTWYIDTNNTAARITLDFDTLFLAANTDNLTIYAGNKTDSPVTVAFTNAQKPVLVVSQGGLVKIVLSRGKQNTTKSKFSLTYNTQECSKNVSGSQGFVESPIYVPGTGDFQCTYRISQPDGVPVVSFTKFDVPVGKLEVFFNTTSVANLTGSDQQDDILDLENSGQPIVLVLSVKNDSQAESFTALYRTVDADCSREISINSTTPSEVALPSSTPFPVTCYWRFTAGDATSRVYIVPSVVQQVGSDVTFTDGGSMYSKRIGAALERVPWYVSSGQKLTVVAYLGSDTNRTAKLQYKQDKFSSLYILGAQPQSVTLMGKDVTGQSVSLQFLASAPTSKVRVELTSSTTLATTNSSVKIQDGQGNTLMTFGKASQLFPVQVSDERALVVVENLNSAEMVALTVAVDTDDDCNQLYPGETGLITASSTEKRNRSCTVAVTSGKATVLSISDVKLCEFQSLKIYAGLATNASLLGTVSRYSPPYSQIFFPKTAAPRLTWDDRVNATQCKQPLLNAVYAPLDPESACGKVDPSATNGVLESPGSPTKNYPLNMQCAWNIPSDNTTQLYMSFSPIRLTERHTLTIKNGTDTYRSFSVNTTTQPDDVVVPNSGISLAFSSAITSTDYLENTGSGFAVTYRILKCGGYIDKSNSSITGPKGGNSSIECVWLIKVAPTGQNGSVNVVFVNFTSSDFNKSTSQDSLTINDQGSLTRGGSPIVDLSSGNYSAYSRHNTLLVRYRFDATADKKGVPFTFNFTYSTFNCNKTNQCKCGDCMLPGWRCNGKVQCPDATDEIGCDLPPPTSPKPTPAPVTGKPSPGKGGIKGYWIFVCLVIGLGLGVLVTILIPRIVRRWRLRSYTGGPSNYGTLHEDA